MNVQHNSPSRTFRCWCLSHYILFIGEHYLLGTLVTGTKHAVRNGWQANHVKVTFCVIVRFLPFSFLYPYSYIWYYSNQWVSPILSLISVTMQSKNHDIDCFFHNHTTIRWNISSVSRKNHEQCSWNRVHITLPCVLIILGNLCIMISLVTCSNMLQLHE